MELYYYLEKGGVIMYILLGFNIIGFSIMLWKFITILIANVKKRSIVQELEKSLLREDIPLNDEHVIIELAKTQIFQKIKKLEFGLNTVKIIASTAPLLGLLGTVIGILSAFNAISTEGMDNPSIFAGGISLALITTVGGLIVAIPHYVGYNYIIGMLDNLEVSLEKRLIPRVLKK